MALPRVVIVGAPNVGKSTLFNRLAGRRRSLVADHPGLTRDLIEHDAVVGGRRVRLVDTGGLMPPGTGPLAQAIRDRVVEAALQADLLLFVVDARRGRTPIEDDLGRIFRSSGLPALLVVNKVDNHEGGSAAADFARLGFDEPVAISAEHALGLAELHDAIAGHLPPAEDSPDAEAAIRIAIAGRPNVGKSSLLNALLRTERSLVSAIPGTTRDSVDAFLESHGKRYVLVDTAGLRRPGRVDRGPESLSVGAARRSVRDADVTLVMIDGSEGVVAQDLHVLGLVAGGESDWLRPAVVLLNKIDLLPSRDAIAQAVERVRERLRFARFAPVIPVSAASRWHLDRILPAADAVHAEATRFIPTGDLNDWLHEAIEAHRPPLLSGRPWAPVFATQVAAQPPVFAILTNRAVKVHFSYARYLENSLRERFALRLTPVALKFRARRKGGEEGAAPAGRGPRGRRRRGSGRSV